MLLFAVPKLSRDLKKNAEVLKSGSCYDVARNHKHINRASERDEEDGIIFLKT